MPENCFEIKVPFVVCHRAYYFDSETSFILKLYFFICEYVCMFCQYCLASVLHQNIPFIPSNETVLIITA